MSLLSRLKIDGSKLRILLIISLLTGLVLLFTLSSDKKTLFDIGISQSSESSLHVINTTVFLDYIHKQCGKHNFSTSWKDPSKPAQAERPRLMITDQHYKILYVSNPKTGSTSFMKFMLRLQGDERPYEKMSFVHKTKYYESPNSVRKSLYQNLTLGEVIRENLYAVGFVRNPITRLISGFRNKVLRTEGGGFNKKIFKKLGTNSADDITRFRAFLNLLVNKKITDPHFSPQWLPMKVCSFPYNMLGTTETTQEHIRTMQFETKTDMFEFPGSRVETGKDTVSTFEEVHFFFDSLSQEEVDSFYEFYRWDFLLMGYTRLGDPSFPYIDLKQ